MILRATWEKNGRPRTAVLRPSVEQFATVKDLQSEEKFKALAKLLWDSRKKLTAEQEHELYVAQNYAQDLLDVENFRLEEK